MRADLSGAANMLSSSFTLSKNIGDLPSQLDALAGLIGIYEKCDSAVGEKCVLAGCHLLRV